MEDGDGLVDTYAKSTENIIQGLNPKFGKTDSQSPVQFTDDEDDHFQSSNCYNNVAKTLCLKESHVVKGKLNGEVGSGFDTNKCDSLIIPDDSKSKTLVDRPLSDSVEVVKVCDEQDNLQVPIIDRKRKNCESPDSLGLQGESVDSEDLKNTSSKKRILSHASISSQPLVFQEAQPTKSIADDAVTLQKNSPVLTESPSSDILQQPSAVPDEVEPDTHLTGFAQYLGLQPIVKFKCFRCEETGFPTLSKLQEHQNICLTSVKAPLHPKPTQPHISVHPSSTNFRISRKVFLCGSCGTYYENWNLFLHMRDVHKRLICLYCLAMFPQSDILASHLTAKHGIVESVYSSPEHLFRECKGPCFLMCCACDAIFTESDDFSNHVCTEKLVTRCQLCGMRGTHFLECPRATGSTGSNIISTSPTSSFSQTDAVSTICESNHSSQTPPRECGGTSVTKYLIPVSSVQVPLKKTAKKAHVLVEPHDITHELSDVDGDDDYDISNAASFCHVNIHEPFEKLTPATTTSLETNLKLKRVGLDVLTPVGTEPKVSSVIKSERNDTSMKLAKDSSSSASLTMGSHLGAEGSKIDSLDKAAIHEVTQNVEDSLLLNKLLEQRTEPASHLVNNTSIESNTNNLKIFNTTDKNVTSEHISKAELNDTCQMPCISTRKAENLAPSCSLTPKIDFNDTCTGTLSPELEYRNNSKSPTPDAECTTSTSPPQTEWKTVTPVSKTSDLFETASSNLLANGPPKLSPVTSMNDSCESAVKIYSIDSKLTSKTDAIDSSSLTDTDIFDSKSPARTDMIEANQPTRKGGIDTNSPERTDEIVSKSPTRIDEIVSKSPTRTDEIVSKSPTRTDVIESKSPVRKDVNDSNLSEQLDMNHVIDSKSPTRMALIDCKSPVRIDMIETSRSPAGSELIDSPPSPHRTEWNDSSKSPLRIESSSSSESSPPGESNRFSKLLPCTSTELNDSSKSPPSTECNYSPCTSPHKELNVSSKLPTELYSPKSPIKSPNSPSNYDGTKLPPTDNHNCTSQSIDNPTATDNSHPLLVAEVIDSSKLPSPEQLTVPSRDFSSDTHVSPTLSDDYDSGSCSEKLPTRSEINPNVPFVTSSVSDTRPNNSSNRENLNIRISKATLKVTVPSRRKAKGKAKASSRSKSLKLETNLNELPVERECEPDIPSITDLETNKEDETGSATVKVKRKKKAGRAAKRYRSKRKNTRSNNADADSINGTDNVLEDLSLPLKTEDMFENIQVAGDEVPVVELHLEDDLEVLTIQVMLQESVKTASFTCVYCNHAKKIAVNGKQLALHLLAEHKFLPVYVKCENSPIMNYLSSDESPSKKLHNSGDILTTEGIDKVSIENRLLMEKYVMKLKTSLASLQDLFLNTDTYDSSDRTFSHPYDRTYECFHCNFLTVLHKELYVHNRKMHQKTILLCIMCKSNFYSYSELLCHLCPGIYVPESNIKFRCHVCSVDSLPSTFRLMVHLRKRHFVCDVCLETTEDQQKLSTHVWKHKLHHLCYRCGIAYRNKPDITKHLFWKHGTESVLCKKCLQKKWPHVYHFCIPPNAFVCEECNASFSRAVALKVHKRLHTGDLPHGCDECEEHFISKKLLYKHQDKHREIPEPNLAESSIPPEESKLSLVKEELMEYKAASEDLTTNQDYSKSQIESQIGGSVETPHDEAESGIKTRVSPVELATSIPNKHDKKAVKKSEVVDVYDLPPLNLSSDSDDSEGDQDLKTHPVTGNNESVDISIPSSTSAVSVTQVEEDNQQPVQVVDGIWDNFQNYKANLERRESQSNENVILPSPPSPPSLETCPDITTVMRDHDYCVISEEKDGTQMEDTDQAPGTSVGLLFSSEQKDLSIKEQVEKTDNDKSNSFDHDYCFNKDDTGIVKEAETQVKVETQATFVSTASIDRDTSNKKTKLQKKKKRSASSSSSDSSSSSGSSSCSCGENCSCSSSSSSSGSSSDSSESDKSNSEGRRRQIARKERRDRVKKKKGDEASTHAPNATDGTPEPEEVNQICGPPEPEDTELPILESDLDTDETETDEDFYDQHPQLLANKLMAEKRNQLLLLTPVNNIITQVESAPPPTSELSPPKKKVKSKKRKKRQHDEKISENKLKLNISSNYYNFQVSNPEVHNPVQSHTHSPMQPLNQALISRLVPAPSIQNTVEPASVSSAAESGSETDSKRLSKRRRMPKKFYGDSSDEDSSSHTKWSRKPQAPITNSPLPCSPLTPPPVYKNPNPPPEPARIQPLVLAISEPERSEPERSEEEDGAETESEQGDVKKSSSDSSSESDGEKEMEIHTDSDAEPPLVVETMPVQQQIAQKNENLYCYCQCPYDEVSEMIACDGKDCTIEWFHFECVGIMVPPKGKWYCPDCRKNAPSKNQYFS